jgi:hypothetical protein
MLLGALVIGVPVGTLIGAVVLRAAVAIYNNLAGGASSPDSVPVPAFGRAMWITFAIFVVQMVVGLLIIGLVTDGGAAAAVQGQGADVVAQLISVPVSLLIMAGMLSARLPTTFGRATLVTLCYMLVSLLVVGVLVGIGVLVLGVTLRGA